VLTVAAWPSTKCSLCAQFYTDTKDFIRRYMSACLSESAAQTCQLSRHGFQFHITSQRQLNAKLKADFVHSAQRPLPHVPACVIAGGVTVVTSVAMALNQNNLSP
jgi:hypothetical protein